jgi:hypothetical protein
MIQSILLILLVGAVVWVLLVILRGGRGLGKQGAAWSDSADMQSGGANRHPGVSIRTYRSGCPAAEALKGNRYSPDQAPHLPLPDCTWARCHCTYSHHGDRRTGNLDRRKMMGSEKEYPMSMGDDDQRDGRGRRVRDEESGADSLPTED